MNDMVYAKNVGALIKAVTSVEPQSATASVNGGGIDRYLHNMPQSCDLHTIAGAVGGAPSAVSVQAKIQDSADNSTFADYKYDGTNVAQGTAVTAANTEDNTSVDLTLARRYIRVVLTISFTGGTSPTVLVCGEAIFGGESLLAAV